MITIAMKKMERQIFELKPYIRRSQRMPLLKSSWKVEEKEEKKNNQEKSCKLEDNNFLSKKPCRLNIYKELKKKPWKEIWTRVE